MPGRSKTVVDTFDIVSPRADALMESLRATGYSLPDAIADLIDNSITADARNVRLNFHWAGSDSWVSIEDDGRGMSESRLVEAMRMGSTSPLEERAPADLGRYGLGMKTASISQARSVTVASKTTRDSATAVRRWDLDYLAESKDWRLLRSATERGLGLLTHLDEVRHGTLVIWERLDRLVGSAKATDARSRRHFLDAVRIVEQHVAMVFHRFMTGSRAVAFWINEQRIDPWDPFLTQNAATQQLPKERLGPAGSSIKVEPYVLPHHSRFKTPDEHAAAGGPAGWNAQQGFYVYRNRRLLLPGDWLGLGYRKEEHYKLARILIDLPNSLDHEWDIDVRKSKARPPLALRDELKRIARVTRERAVTVYRHRGKTISRTNLSGPVFVWNRKIKNKRVSYVVNREHPVVRETLRNKANDGPSISRLLRLVEEYIPIQQIWIDAAEGDENQSQPFESAASREIVELIQLLYRAYRSSGLTHQDALDRLKATEGFGDRFELVDQALLELKQNGAS